MQHYINNQFTKMNNPPTTKMITTDAPLVILANFLKFSPPGQFYFLNEEQLNLLKLVLEDAYLFDQQQNQRPKESALNMLSIRRRHAMNQKIRGKSKFKKLDDFLLKTLKQQTKPQLTQSRINKSISWYSQLFSCFERSLQTIMQLPKNLMSKENKLNYEKEVLPQLNLQEESQPLCQSQPQAKQSSVSDHANHKKQS